MCVSHESETCLSHMSSSNVCVCHVNVGHDSEAEVQRAALLQCVAVCCSVLQCVADCCSVLQLYFSPSSYILL